MQKGIMDVFECRVCGAQWSHRVSRGRPSAYCGETCRRAGRTGQRRVQRSRSPQERDEHSQRRMAYGPLPERPTRAHAASVAALFEALEGGYLVEAEGPSYRPESLPEHLRYPGLKSGPYEGCTSSQHLRVLGSDRPWNEC